MSQANDSSTPLGRPKTGPRRTLPAAKVEKDFGRQRRYPVLGRPSGCVRNNFTSLESMTYLLNLTDTTNLSLHI